MPINHQGFIQTIQQDPFFAGLNPGVPPFTQRWLSSDLMLMSCMPEYSTLEGESGSIVNRVIPLGQRYYGDFECYDSCRPCLSLPFFHTRRASTILIEHDNTIT